MFTAPRPFVKICCIASIEEAQIAVSHGASALGLVARMPSGPGPISDELICTIAAAVPPPIATFMLTSETKVKDIVAHHHRTQTNTIQLVDALEEEDYDSLKAQLPSIRIVQVIHVVDEASVEEAVRISEKAHALLLDSGNPQLAVKELGGTGRVHNWLLSRRIVQQSKVPVFLAGGLNPSNAKRALDEVQPYGLDLCSGVRTNGHLDPQKLSAFFAAIT